MRKRLTRAFILFLIAGVFTTERVLAQRYVADEVVAVVGNSMILYSEVEEVAYMIERQRREDGYTSDRDAKSEALEYLMQQRFLATQARIDSLELGETNLNSQVERQMERIIAERGSVKEVEKFYNKPIFNVRQEIRNRMQEQQLAARMQSEIQSKVTVTPSEVERYFRRLPKDSIPLIPEQYIYAQIVIYPPSTDEAKLRVRERLLELRERIINGESFAALARLYSADGSAARGGEIDAMPLEGFVQPFADALEDLKPDQISNVVETEFGFHIIQMIEKRGDLYRSRHILMRPEFTIEDQQKAATKLDSLAGLIRADSLKFTDAVNEFSEDTESRLNEGTVINKLFAESYNVPRLASNKFLKEELPVMDYEQLRQLQPGQVSQAFRTVDFRGNEMYKVVKLLEIIPTHRATLKEDYIKIEDMALEDKKDQYFEEWLNKKIQGMLVRIEEPYRSTYVFENKNWLK